jgi:hypothetical protein
LPNGEILLVALDPHGHRPWADANNRFIVADMHGTVLHTAKMPGAAWHGPRAVDASGGTLMYAEYPWNDPRQGSDSAAHKTSRVWRSRDFGRSWRQVFEQGAVRHFHYLQARPGVTGEWWLTSGDEPEESRIWRSTDDGDTWIDQTGTFGPFITIGNYRFSRSLFRLTDLAWAGDEIIWGSDDVLNATVETTGSSKPARSRGSRVFCANPSTGMAPTVVGNCGPEVRSIVDVGKFYVLATQSSRGFADKADGRVRAGPGPSFRCRAPHRQAHGFHAFACEPARRQRRILHLPQIDRCVPGAGSYFALADRIRIAV